MNVAFAGPAVEASSRPHAVRSLGGDRALVLGAVLTVIGRTPSLAHVLGLRSIVLTRLSADPLSEYHLGTELTGVRFRPIDARGRALATAHAKESLMTVRAVRLLAVGQTQAEAVSA